MVLIYRLQLGDLRLFYLTTPDRPSLDILSEGEPNRVIVILEKFGLHLEDLNRV
jgi:hypothetical protein